MSKNDSSYWMSLVALVVVNKLLPQRPAIETFLCLFVNIVEARLIQKGHQFLYLITCYFICHTYMIQFILIIILFFLAFLIPTDLAQKLFG